MSEIIKKAAAVLLAVSIAVCAVFAYFHDKKRMQAYEQAHDKFMSMASGYKAEQSELRRELEELKKEIDYYGDETNIMVGFAVTSKSDIAYIREKTEKYKFAPTIVLDGTLDFAEMTALLETAEKEWEIMLSAPSLTGYTGTVLASAKAQLEAEGRKVCNVVFSRMTSISTRGEVILSEAGFAGCSVYHDSPVSGQTESGLVYFDFSRIASANVEMEVRLSACYGKAASMIYVFDMESVRAGYVSDGKVEDYLQTLALYAEKENCAFATVTETAAALSGINELKAELNASREQQMVSVEARIKELYKIIMQIHNECFAGVF